jgi:predicted RNA binding protein YcfA (HicA-like mRNA interferase family)
MVRLPRVTAGKVIRILERKGFRLVRQSGSHKIFRNDEGTRVTVPYHSGKILHPKVLSQILSDCGITVEEFRRHL